MNYEYLAVMYTLSNDPKKQQRLHSGNGVKDDNGKKEQISLMMNIPSSYINIAMTFNFKDEKEQMEFVNKNKDQFI